MDLTTNRREWVRYSKEDMERFVEMVFNHYRKTGFPYFPTDMQFRRAELDKFVSFDYMKLFDGKTIGQSMHGLAFCWSYMPHAYSVKCNNMRTPLETFSDDDLFMQVIRKRIEMGDNVTPNGIRKMLKIFTGTQCVSNFRPTAAAVIYELFGKKKTVWDMSCGYGGRMLGAMRAKVDTYIGTEPCKETFNGLMQMLGDFPQFRKHTQYQLHECGSECFVPETNSLDLCFTSPPYFDTEKYSDDETQSYIKYPSREMWMNGFMKQTLENCFIGLKEDGILAINIANVGSYKNIESDTVEMAKKVGFVYNSTINYALSSLSHKSVFKHEPIYIFTKSEKDNLFNNISKKLF